MKTYRYKVHIRCIEYELKFNCNSIHYLNRMLRKFIRTNGYRLNNSFKLIKNNNLFYFSNYEKNKICK